MNVVADIFVFGDGVDEFFRHVLRMRGREAYAIVLVDARNGRHQVRESTLSPSCTSSRSVPASVTSLKPLDAKLLHLAHDASIDRLRSRPRVKGTTQNVQNLSQPRITDIHALIPSVRKREDVVVVFHTGEANRNASLALERSFDEFRQSSVLVRTDHEVDMTLRLP